MMGTPDQMAFRMRSSKFRHVYGAPVKKEQCYEGVKITKNAHDSNFCAVNPKFIAIVTEAAGGGSFLVLPLDRTGRVDVNTPKVCGHAGPVLDVKWSPFDDNVIASSSDDTTVKLWFIPDGGLKANQTEWLVDLHGHSRRVGYIEWHPTAQGILLSAGYDFKCILWNTETAEPINIITVHPDTIFCIAWNKDGSLFATTCKDKKLRVIDPREGVVVAEGSGHVGSKAAKVVFLGDGRLFTTGFSKLSERQYAIWDMKNLSKPLKMETVDSSSGILLPFYDRDTGVVFLAGKGDGNIRYYEVVPEQPYCHYLSQYTSGSPQRGLGILPKRGIDVSRCEIVRFYKLHTVKNIVEPISMIVPRKSEMFQDDIFPPTVSSCPSLTADEWLSGQNRESILISLKDGQMQSVPKVTAAKAVQRKVNQASTTVSTVSSGRDVSKKPPSGRKGASSSHSPRSPRAGKTVATGSLPSRKQSLEHKKDGAISNTPTITTYRAVKRGNSSTDSGSHKRNATFTSPTSAASEKIPASVRNIEKLSVSSDITDLSPAPAASENGNEAHNENHNIETQQTTRLTNAQEPIRVDKKVWSSSYSPMTSEVSASNGIPKTDPEPVSLPSLVRGQSATTVTPQSALLQHQRAASSDVPPTSSSSSSSQAQSLTLRTQLLRSQSERGRTTRPERESKTTSAFSTTSDVFITPPSSPFGDMTPTREARLSWRDNPLFSQTTPQSEVDTGPLDELLNDAKAEDTNTKPSNISPAPWKLTRQSDRDLSSLPVSSSDSSSKVTLTRVGSHGAHNGDYNRLDLQDDSEGQDTEMIDFLSTDAPDDTLIKPSKLRASMRSRKGRGSLRDKSRSFETSNDTSNGQSHEAGQRPEKLDSDMNSARMETSPESLLSSGPTSPQSLRSSGPTPPHDTHLINQTSPQYTHSVKQTSPQYTHSTKHISPQYTHSTTKTSPQYTFSTTKTSPQYPQSDNQTSPAVSLTSSISSPEAAVTSDSVSRRHRGSFRSSATLHFQGSSPGNRHSYSGPSESTTVRVNSTTSPVVSPDRHEPHTKPTSHFNRSYTWTSSDLDIVISPPSPARPQQSAYLSQSPSISPSKPLSPPHPATVTMRNRPRDSGRRRRRVSRESDSAPETEQKVHVKKVWSPTPPSPPSVPVHNGIPGTDAELRKAYFRQLEEIRSLKEQIVLKDKRIRQLEAEVQIIKNEQGDPGAESNC